MDILKGTGADARFDYDVEALTLSFKNRSSENRFIDSYFETNLQIGRICHQIGMFFYALVTIWDALVYNPGHFADWLVILPFVEIYFLAGYVSSYLAPEFYRRNWQPLFASYVLVTGLGFIIVTVLAAPGLPLYLFIGIIFCLIFCYTFIRLTFLWAAFSGNTLVFLYMIAVIMVNDPPLKLLLTQFVYMYGINLLGMMVCYTLEMMARREFALNSLLQKEGDQIKELNTLLESKVAERTVDLRESLGREKALVQRLEISLHNLEKSEDIAKLGYFEILWDEGILKASKGLSKLLEFDEVREQIPLADIWKMVPREIAEELNPEMLKLRGDSKPFECEFPLTLRDGRALWIRGIIDPVGMESGKRLSKGIFQDLSEQKKAQDEQEKMERQLIRSQKLEAIGKLAGGVAHDYNNISGIIVGYAELAMNEMKRDNPLFKNLEHIHSAALKAAGVTRQLLAFARKETIMPRVLHLENEVENILSMLRRLIGENVKLIWQPSQEAETYIKMDPTQFVQILTNLCINARDAIGDIGEITIETKQQRLDGSYGLAQNDFRAGDYAELIISDDGEGMDAKTIEHIFEPFFSTKGEGLGTGLGLATIYGIVKQNGGTVDVISEPGKGSVFKIYLPLYNKSHTGSKAKKQADPIRSKGESILLVEDDPLLLDMSSHMLEQLGYKVQSTTSPKEALSILSREAVRIDLLISDVIMPEMNGRQLADEARRDDKDLKVLFSSGYTASIIAHKGVLDEDVNFISKPYSMQQLAQKIRDILD